MNGAQIFISGGVQGLRASSRSPDESVEPSNGKMQPCWPVQALGFEAESVDWPAPDSSQIIPKAPRVDLRRMMVLSMTPSHARYHVTMCMQRMYEGKRVCVLTSRSLSLLNELLLL